MVSTNKTVKDLWSSLLGLCPLTLLQGTIINVCTLLRSKLELVARCDRPSLF